MWLWGWKHDWGRQIYPMSIIWYDFRWDWEYGCDYMRLAGLAGDWVTTMLWGWSMMYWSGYLCHCIVAAARWLWVYLRGDITKMIRADRAVGVYMDMRVAVGRWTWLGMAMDDRNDANIAVIPICDSLSFSSSFRSSTKLRILLRQCRIFQKLSQASLVINTIRFFTIILIIGETRKSSYQRADSPFSSILLLVPSSSLIMHWTTRP